jgi:mRNA interferase MazF
MDLVVTRSPKQVVVIKRFDVFLVNLDPTVGAEVQKTRPCVVVSPDEMNRHIAPVIVAPVIVAPVIVAPVIVAPLTSQGRLYPTRVNCHFQGKNGLIVLDQLRTVDKVRLVKRLGRLSADEQGAVLQILAEMFAK